MQAGKATLEFRKYTERIHPLRQIWWLLSTCPYKIKTKSTQTNRLTKPKTNDYKTVSIWNFWSGLITASSQYVSPAERAAANQQHSHRAAEHAATPASPCL